MIDAVVFVVLYVLFGAAMAVANYVLDDRLRPATLMLAFAIWPVLAILIFIGAVREIAVRIGRA